MLKDQTYNRWITSLESVKGIGSRRFQQFQYLLKSETPKVIDLLFYLPSKEIFWQTVLTSAQLQKQCYTILKAIVLEIKPYPTKKGRSLVHVLVSLDDGVTVTLIYFNYPVQWIKARYKPKQTLWIYGLLEHRASHWQIVHPQRVEIYDEAKRFSQHEKIYPSRYGLTSSFIKSCIQNCLKECPELPEWLPDEIVKAYSLPTFKESLMKLHGQEPHVNPHPTDPYQHNAVAEDAPCSDTSRYKLRLILDELYVFVLRLERIKKDLRCRTGIARHRKVDYSSEVERNLPFAMTQAQIRVIEEIRSDLSSCTPMLRLLQGDVGSGKTLVALMAALHVIESGAQVALMVPTEILVQQHLETVKRLAPMVKCARLSGKEKRSERKTLLEHIQCGAIELVIGTHALLQSDVVFKQLGLVIIDEQHRFGVVQRFELTKKGEHTDLLLMTATPIPRTLALTLFSDLKVSIINEKPKARQAIQTLVLSIKQRETLIARIGHKLALGEQVYWVCPLIEESEELPLVTVHKRYKTLQALYGDRVSILHGKLNSEEKRAAIKQFSLGSTQILVATTVIEVGIDIPAATVIVIEHAERFGLAQLHQLRGRVGRNTKPSTCILLYDYALSAVAKQRLNIMRQSNDGFHIAEADLELRGEGDLGGTKQSGSIPFRFVDLNEHLTHYKRITEFCSTRESNDSPVQEERNALCLALFEQGTMSIGFEG